MIIKENMYFNSPGLEQNPSGCWQWRGWLLRVVGAKAQNSCSWWLHCWHVNLVPAPYSLQPMHVKGSGEVSRARGCCGWQDRSICSPRVWLWEVGYWNEGDLLRTSDACFGNSMEGDLCERNVCFPSSRVSCSNYIWAQSLPPLLPNSTLHLMEKIAN